MKISIAKSVLLPKLAQLAKISDGKVIPILGDILFTVNNGVLMMVAADSIMSMSCITKDVKILKTGVATIPAKKLTEIVKKMGDVIELEKIGMKVRVTSGKSKYELAGQDPSMFPMPSPMSGEKVTIDGSKFKDLIKRTYYAVAADTDNQKILQGVKLRVRASKLTATACDKHRLAEVSHDLKTGFTEALCVVKGSLFKEFIDALPDGEISLWFEVNGFHIETDDYKISMRVLDGTYPVTDGLFPKSSKIKVDVNVKEFKLALERALIVALDDKTNILRLDISVDNILITAVTETDKASEVVEAKIKGEGLTISFNGKYMVEALANVPSDTVTLFFEEVMKPILLQIPNLSDYQLVLPYRTRY